MLLGRPGGGIPSAAAASGLLEPIKSRQGCAVPAGLARSSLASHSYLDRRLAMGPQGSFLLLLAAWSCSIPVSSHFPPHLARLSNQRSTCKPMPSGLSLCHGVGYSQMRLPNLLGHDSVKEVLQQAASWVPLLAKRCHQDTQRFLCSLFAPVCISELDDQAVLPCRPLCQAVRDGCSPVMAAFGFPWPEMLNCSRFPQGNELCIPPISLEERLQPPKEDVVCAPCLETGHGEKELLENFCTLDFALKMSLKLVTRVGGDVKVIPEPRGRTLYKEEGWSEEERRKPVFWLVDGETCSCEELVVGPNSVVLAAGHRVAGRLVISWVRKWQRGEKELKKFSRAVRKVVC